MKNQKQASVARILYIDGNRQSCDTFEQVIGKGDYLINIANSGVEALELIKHHLYPVILTESRIPGMDGMMLIERILSVYPNTIFIVVTEQSDFNLQLDEHLNQSIISIVGKPYDNEDMLSSVKRAFELHEKRFSRQLEMGNVAKSEKKIMLLEDDPTDAEIYHALLKKSLQNCIITHVERLCDALEILHQDAYEAVVTDLTLPDARGLDTVVRLNAAAPTSAIIVLSGMQDEDLAMHALQYGAQDYLLKGEVDSASLLRALRFACERKRVEQQLAQLAHHDQLTGLVNRMTLRDRLSIALARAHRFKTSFAVLFLDLDGFKSINDSYGHDVGDALLQELACRLQKSTRDYDTVARLGGDEFVVLIDTLEDKTMPQRIAQRILDSLAQPMNISEHELMVATSIGIATYPEAGDSVEELLKCADTAMYAAKQVGGNNFHIFSPGRECAKSLTKIRIENDLRSALERNEFLLHYQPQLDLANNKVVAMEALLRWARYGDSLVPPSEFIPILEEIEQMIGVGEWVLMEACNQLCRWREIGFGDLCVAVNLSVLQLQRSDSDVIKTLEQILDQTGLPANAIELEISESLLMSNTVTTISTLMKLKELGVQITVDDFGMGYSSSEYLRRFSVDKLKIDRVFVHRIDKSEEDEKIVSAIIKLGHELNLKVVAEGVESDRQLKVLQIHDCNIIQGFMISRAQENWSDQQLNDLIKKNSMDIVSPLNRQAQG